MEQLRTWCTVLVSLLLLTLTLPAQTATTDPGGVLSRLTVARFIGSGSDSIQAMASDAAGNVYVAGTTSSLDFPVKNASQPASGESVLMRSTDRGATWQRLSNPPSAALRVSPHPVDQSVFFAGCFDGIYKTIDGGQSWRRVYRSATLAGTAKWFNIVIDPANTSNVYVYDSAANPKFIASGDGGETWVSRTPPTNIAIQPGLSNQPVLWVDPNGSGILGLGLWVSFDRGISWSEMTSPANWIRFTLPVPGHSGWIYSDSGVGVGGNLFLSKDWGKSWTQLQGPLRSFDSYELGLESLLIDPAQPATLYAFDTFFGFDISNDSGATWHAGHLTGFGPGALLDQSCGGGGLFALNSLEQTVYRSLDFGVTSQPAQLRRVLDLESGPGCTVYAVQSVASDAFVAKLGPGSTEVLWSTFLGGSDADSATAIALDDQGNVYVSGNTASTDFPSTADRIGPPGKQNAFLSKFDSSGSLIYSRVVGGEGFDTVTALAIGAGSEAHVGGYTHSQSFPTTPGAFQTKAGNRDGFALKFAADGSLVYASYLPGLIPPPAPQIFSSVPPPNTVGVAAERSGTALYGGYDGVIYRMSADGSSLTSAVSQTGQIYAMESDSQGNIFVTGVTAAGAASASCFYGFVYNVTAYYPPGDIYVTKLEPTGLNQVFSSRIHGTCLSSPGSIRVGSSGEVTLSASASRGFQLVNPALTIGTCSSSAVARFSADGSQIQYSSFLDSCLTPAAIAVGADGAIYAAVKQRSPSGAGILRIPVPSPGGPTVLGFENALTRAAVSASPGALRTISGRELSAGFVDLGLNDPNPLPTQLGGVRVLFDGVAAELMQVAPDHLICVVPDEVTGHSAAIVQVFNGSVASPELTVPVVNTEATALLTRWFPDVPQTIEGTIRNEDVSLNDADHPAAPGSTVTLYATGVLQPGPFFLFWSPPAPQRIQSIEPLYGMARRMPGFINTLWAVDFRIPDAPGPGVYFVPVPGKLSFVSISGGTSTIGVYVK